eukprot:TRINITY_DN7901_c0_g3_i1.p1 TRINITY_DN7901_c0_g3~~TRINITY_DN7901_c0_g3_i1.p1  ORF type:complete len:346 (-),score=37.77 TRINITY_DN7901_c0_g3_i1:95-1132(-)
MDLMPGYGYVRKLGSGAQARVYEAVAREGIAENIDTGNHVAMKIFRARVDQAVVQSELRCLTAAQGHRNIIRLFATIDARGVPKAILLELCCTDLHCLVEKSPLIESKAVKIVRDVLFALQHVHTIGIVHRDVKPDNIALGEDGNARLLDFGVATFIDDVEGMNLYRGTPGYAAPEIMEKRAYGFQVDIFSLGVTFYFVFSCQMPFSTPKMPHASIAMRMKMGLLSFGDHFDQISGDTKDVIALFTYGAASGRPKASDALGLRPFLVSQSVEEPLEAARPSAPVVEPRQPEEPRARPPRLVPRALEAARPLAPVVEPRQPQEPRARPPRPAPKARVRQPDDPQRS